MPGYHTHHIIRPVGGVDDRLRVPTDRRQCADLDGHALRLCAAIAGHARPTAEALLVDPGRVRAGRFARLPAGEGFALDSVACPLDDENPPPYRGLQLHDRRQGGVQ